MRTASCNDDTSFTEIFLSLKDSHFRQHCCSKEFMHQWLCLIETIKMKLEYTVVSI